MSRKAAEERLMARKSQSASRNRMSPDAQ